MRSLALNMLCFNGETLIETSLRSILPYVTEAHIIDTGSTDKTMDILRRLRSEFPHLEMEQVDTRGFGVTWVDWEKNRILTELLNKLKVKTKAHWILRADDDEVFPERTMLEILDVLGRESTAPVYSIRYVHFEKEGNCIIEPRKHKGLRVARLFKNTEFSWWGGNYGREVITISGHRISSNKCPLLRQPFLHLGEYRTGIWKHEYRYHEKGHCGLPIPEEYKQYLPI